jgi:hypothetical protein
MTDVVAVAEVGVIVVYESSVVPVAVAEVEQEKKKTLHLACLLHRVPSVVVGGPASLLLLSCVSTYRGKVLACKKPTDGDPKPLLGNHRPMNRYRTPSKCRL